MVSDTPSRLLAFAVNCFRLTNRLTRTAAGRYMANQLMRAGASAGANYQEAVAAESRADFTHKMQIVLKELRECGYWLQLIDGTESLPGNVVGPIHKEAVELANIFGKSVVTLKTKTR